MASAHVRFVSALAGAPVAPVAAGLSFVDPSLFPGPGGPARSPASVLAHACEQLHLDFAFVPSWEPWALDAVRELGAVDVRALWTVAGVFTPVLEGDGAGAVLRATERDPGRLAEALDRSGASAAASIATGLASGADAVVVADDLAGADGPLLSPAFLDSEVFPRLALLSSQIADAGLPAILHSDGAAETLYASIREAGFAAVHGDCGGAQRTAAALAAARRAGLALAGGIAASKLTDHARAVAAGAEAAAMATSGGLLVCDDGGVATAAECAALFAALGAARR
jgi:hypothetical protein